MTCPTARDHLALLLYGDLSPNDTSATRQHVAECAVCRAELEALELVRGALNATDVPPVSVDAARIAYLAAKQPAPSRRWRQAAAACTLAAAVIGLAVVKLDVRISEQQLIVSWGWPAQATTVVGPGDADLYERVRTLQQLTHSLAADIDTRDRRRAGELERANDRIDRLRLDTDERLREAGRDVDALYAARFKPSQGEGTP